MTTMWLDYGQAVMQERQTARNTADLEAYLQREYGSSGGVERVLAEANDSSAPRPGLRALVARLLHTFERPHAQPPSPAAPVEGGLSESAVRQRSPQAVSPLAGRAMPAGRRRGPRLRPQAPLAPPRR